MAHSNKPATKDLFIYGKHPIELALANPKRRIRELYYLRESIQGFKIPQTIKTKCVDKAFLDNLVGRDTLHQGLVARVDPLPAVSMPDLLKKLKDEDRVVVILLDQVTDPHNVGAILRSSIAFDAAAVVVPEAGAPDETGVLAKSASGALELIPLVRVTNLIRAMEKLKEEGFWCIGLDGYADQSVTGVKLPSKCAFVMGSEGSGMRRLTRENCDYCVKLPMNPAIESLNVSNAAALTLYEYRRQYPSR